MKGILVMGEASEDCAEMEKDLNNCVRITVGVGGGGRNWTVATGTIRVVWHDGWVSKQTFWLPDHSSLVTRVPQAPEGSLSLLIVALNLRNQGPMTWLFPGLSLFECWAANLGDHRPAVACRPPHHTRCLRILAPNDQYPPMPPHIANPVSASPNHSPA